jgi:hypothetical protein
MTDIDILKKETNAWTTNSNEKQRGVNWQFKVEDARCKLRSLYTEYLIFQSTSVAKMVEELMEAFGDRVL